MSVLTPDDFDAFFQELYGHEPFPWQKRLARRVIQHGWGEESDPSNASEGRTDLIALPTASGKTACIDIAVFALACQADRPAAERTAPRRIFFVVDRRVIVDEASRRAERLAERLVDAKSEVLVTVAKKLRGLAGHEGDHPLDCYQLRGGIYRDNAWVRSPLQPTVIASTVDQVGSRLLFRGYGVSDSAKPIHAGLIGNDSLIILDEAHCAQPFRETMEAVKRYRGEKWTESEQHLATPFHFVQMSATPREGKRPFELDDEDRENKELRKRLDASKPARLVEAKSAKGTNAAEKLADTLQSEAERIVKDHSSLKAVATIVNRVRTARLLYDKLRKAHGEDRVHLMIGRMRPVDRDELTKRLQDLFASGAKREQWDEPHFVVATQCLEVGADFDFDGMVSECAGIDALRQRFGRLNRIGRDIQARASIVIAAQDIKPKTEDPIYGPALPETWKWLNDHAEDGVVDFRIASMDELWNQGVAADPELPSRLKAPAPHAPVMLPAHVDCWCQTSPMPTPDPDVALFLHGPDRGQSEVQVCWRADLPVEPDDTAWTQAVSLCPPTSAECLSVPIGVMKRWLTAAGDAAESLSDVEGAATEVPLDKKDRTHVHEDRRPLAWRGLQKSRVIADIRGDNLKPGDTLVLPVTAGGWSTFGHIPGAPDDPAEKSKAISLKSLTRTDATDNDRRWARELISLDIANQASLRARDRITLRLHPTAPPFEQPWLPSALSRQLKGCATEERRADLHKRDVKDVIALPEHNEALDELVSTQPECEPFVRALRGSFDLRPYPDIASDGDENSIPPGYVLHFHRRLGLYSGLTSYDDGEDTTSAVDGDRSVRLDQHLVGVSRWAHRFGECLNTQLGHAAVIAARLHDLGKADPRFQAYLLKGVPAQAHEQPHLWAKHPNAPVTYQEHRLAAGRSGRPDGFRHELLSVALVQDRLDIDVKQRQLILHLIASHHGYCRPFAPVVDDPHPTEVRVTADGRLPGEHLDADVLTAPSNTGLERLNSGVAERFWKLTRRYGWWGLPYLEAVLRLADWKRSEEEDRGVETTEEENAGTLPILSASPTRSNAPQSHELLLPGLDGGNPLAFLAALGTLRTLTHAWPERKVKMSWTEHRGAWRPVLHGCGNDEEHLLEQLESALIDTTDEPFKIDKKLPFLASQFADTARKAQQMATPHDRQLADFLVAFGSEALVDDKGVFKDTLLRMVRSGDSAGQGLPVYASRIRNETGRADLERTLHQQWTYQDDRCALRWDPIEDSRYALQWTDPSKEGTRSMRGANRLAIEAMPLLLTVPVATHACTVGFRQFADLSTYWTWPIWNCPVSLDCIRSLLAGTELQNDPPDIGKLRAMGVEKAYRSKRVPTSTYYRNFTPARAV